MSKEVNAPVEKLGKFVRDKGYFPELYNPYNDIELKELSPSLTTACGRWDSSSTVMICETISEKKHNVSNNNIERTNMSEKIEKIGSYAPNGHNSHTVVKDNGIAPTVMDNHGQVTAVLEDTERCIQVGELEINDLDRARRVYSDDGLAGSLTVNINHDSKYEVKTDRLIQTAEVIKKGTDASKRVYSQDGIAPTCTTCAGGGIEPKVDTYLRIRKLTPKECYRLMGFEDKDYQACVDIGFGSSATYHTAGDSIVTTVLMGLMGSMLLPQEEVQTIIQEYADTLAERKPND